MIILLLSVLTSITLLISTSSSIVCDDMYCMVDCRVNETLPETYDCIDSIIDYSNDTRSLDILCAEDACSNAIIHCPQQCNIICDGDECDHYNTTIIYSDLYADDIHINCTEYGSCQDMTFIIDNLHLNHLINLTINCNDLFSCRNAVFSITATNINQIYVLCAGVLKLHCSALFDIHSPSQSSTDVTFECTQCYSLTIKAPLVNSLLMKCSSCNNINLYPPYSTKYSTQITGWGYDYIYLFVPFFYEMDYLLIGTNCAYRTGPSNAPRTGHKYIYMCCMYSHTYSDCVEMSYFGPTADPANRYKCRCGESDHQMNCCPLSGGWQSYTCRDDPCVVDLGNTNEYVDSKLRIFADNVTSLSVIGSTYMQGTSFFPTFKGLHIYANNITLLNITMFGTGANVKVYAAYVDQFILKCLESSSISVTCNRMMIDVSHANNINIYAQELTNSVIVARYAGNLSMECRQDIERSVKSRCSDVDVYIPQTVDNNSNVTLTCIGKNACNNISIYADDGLHDTHPLYIHLEFCGLRSSNDINGVNVYCEGAMCDDNVMDYTVSNDLTQCLSVPQPNRSSFGLALSFLCGIVLCMVAVYVSHFTYLKYIQPQRYSVYLHIFPPSRKSLLYFHFVNLLEWMSQIYFVFVITRFESAYASMCLTMNGDYCAFVEPCTSDCRTAPSITTALGFTLTIMCGCFLFECTKMMHLLKPNVSDPVASSVVIISGRDSFIFYIFPSKSDVWNAYRNVFNARELFTYHQWKTKYVWRPLYCLIRYVLFFSLIFAFHYEWDGMNGNIEWYELYAVFVLWIVHQFVKYLYSILPPYDEAKHRVWIVEEIYGRHIASIILQYCSRDAPTHAQRTPNTKNTDNKTRLVSQTSNDKGRHGTTIQLVD
eukprot:756082_1